MFKFARHFWPHRRTKYGEWFTGRLASDINQKRIWVNVIANVHTYMRIFIYVYTHTKYYKNNTRESFHRSRRIVGRATTNQIHCRWWMDRQILKFSTERLINLMECVDTFLLSHVSKFNVLAVRFLLRGVICTKKMRNIPRVCAYVWYN